MLESPLPQLDRLFDYLVPEALVQDAQPGVRVKVPLRSAGRTARGYIVSLAEHTDTSRTLSELDEVVSPLPVLTPEVWALARRLADRAAGSACDIVRLAVPPRFVRVEKAFLAARGAASPREASTDAVTGSMGLSSGETVLARVPHLTGYVEADARHLLEPGARSAISAVATVAGLGTADAAPPADARPVSLAHGHATMGHWALTAAELAVAVLAGGESTIVVLPDHRDQAQLEAALAHLGAGDSVVRLDARQARTERYANFLSALSGDPCIVVGNRSSVYAPVGHLGQIIIWDDGDPLQSEPLAPYVHARDAALVRQEQSGCRLVFLSHSRSTEVERLVEIGFLHRVEPAPRYLPRVVPTAEQDDADAPRNAARIPSSAWKVARSALEHGPVLIQVARPGYAPVLACRSCGTAAACTVCGGALHVTRAGDPPSCTLCGALATSWVCRHCQGTTLRSSVVGAARTADELGRAFPGVRVVVSDGEREVLTVDDRPAIVVATRGAEPVAAHGYRAVLLLDGPRMLARESLRVAEDCLRWWSNAIALAAPGATSVLVGVGGELARALATWRQDGVASSELADRRALRFPPAVRLATLTGTSAVVTDALTALRGLVTDAEWAKMDTLGPVPVDDGSVRAIVRFDYAVGAAVAGHLRALVVKNATSRRSKTPGSGSRPAPTLRVRLDDSEILE
ncbi:primosomal protein N' [Herbiconiux moechotypicola]|nr:primosomal protein N' [Herbiconiux moechotypicola]MCS5728626.1 primosomal protein N' [Herbiconiux moechotypicola]